MAMPIASNNDPSQYLIKGKDLSWLSMGIYGGQFERSIKWDNGIVQNLKSTRWLGYIGADIFSGMTVYAVGGQSESCINDGDYADAEAEYGAGIHVNVLNHFIREPTLTEDDIRLNVGARYLHSSSDITFEGTDWDEVSAYMTIELVNHTIGNKFYTPESISLYVGPIYSALISSDFEEDKSVGVIGGLEIFIVDTIALDIEVQYFDDASLSAGINFRF
jgi:hypothetical protein